MPGGLILIALLCDGDYNPHGLRGCGLQTAVELAQAGFGDTLLTTTLTSTLRELQAFISSWRLALKNEFYTNSSGLMAHKHPRLAEELTEEFPCLDVLRAYTHPVVSVSPGPLQERCPDLGILARYCESTFRWEGESIIGRFRTLIWQGATLRALLKHRNAELKTHNTGPEHLIGRIYGTRKNTANDGILEYRVEVKPGDFIAETRAGIKHAMSDNIYRPIDDGGEMRAKKEKQGNRKQEIPRHLCKFASLDAYGYFKLHLSRPGCLLHCR
ncbi:hypothetical protein K439DRAFT_1530080 [Ramaria rubella]|nr:hypothetical protein K439DRAFT_1530080 [Ramaria rubella]